MNDIKQPPHVIHSILIDNVVISSYNSTHYLFILSLYLIVYLFCDQSVIMRGNSCTVRVNYCEIS